MVLHFFQPFRGVALPLRDLAGDPHGLFVERGPNGETDPLDLGIAAVPTGASVTLRTYRLALVTDPTYATYFGGAANVTAAKVTLMNRVDQVYEDETAIRLWSNLPDKIDARQIAKLYRTRWRIETMFQRLEALLHSEIRSRAEPAKVPTA